MALKTRGIDLIVSQLHGRLGNQLFQYALGRHLAQIHRVPLYFHLMPAANYPLSSYALSPFNIRKNLLSDEQVSKMLQNRSCWRRSKLKSIKETNLSFDPAILKLNKNVYLSGYWQSENYFKPIEPLIREELQIIELQEGKDLEIAQEIAECSAISVHIRRGDYVSNKVIHEVHGTCSINYYQECADAIAKTIDHPYFFIFTDDPIWAKSFFKLPYPMKIIDHNSEEHAYKDLQLMSQCKHHIIANSSFSWWGAYLNPSHQKQIFAPKQWFRSEELNAQTTDLIPKSWNRR